jgi:hypothetical protein
MSRTHDGIIIRVARIMRMPVTGTVTPVLKIIRRRSHPSSSTAIAEQYCKPPMPTLCAIPPR